MTHNIKTRANSSTAFRSVDTVERVETNGQEYLKASGVLAKEGVYAYPRANSNRPQREYLPGDALDASAEAWDGTPLYLDHPIDENGQATVLDSGEGDHPQHVGELRAPEVDIDDGEATLKGEAWLDLSNEGDGEFDTLVESLEDGEVVETSAAYRANKATESGFYGGDQYDGVQRPILPDHVAVFSPDDDTTGNCSVESGCGIGRANSEPSDGGDYAAGDIDDETAASIGRRVLDAVGLGGLFERANDDGGASDGDESAESDAGNDDEDSTMKDNEKIKTLVNEHGLDKENIAPLEGEDCLDTIYTKFEGEAQSADSGGDDGGDSPKVTDGDDAPDGMEAVANQLTELSEEISDVKDRLNEQQRETKRAAAEKIAAKTGVSADDVEISADAAEDMVGGADMVGAGGFGGTIGRANSDDSDDTAAYARGKRGADRFTAGD